MKLSSSEEAIGLLDADSRSEHGARLHDSNVVPAVVPRGSGSRNTKAAMSEEAAAEEMKEETIKISKGVMKGQEEDLLDQVRWLQNHGGFRTQNGGPATEP